MKKILFLLLLIPSVSFGQFLRLPYSYLLHTYVGDTIKQYFSEDSAKWYSDKGYFSFNKPIYSQGKKTITANDTINKWLPKTSSAANSNLFQNHDSVYYNLSLTRKIKASDTTRWGAGGGSAIYANTGLYKDGDTIKFDGILTNNTNDNSIQITNNSTGTGIYTDNNSTGYSNFISNNSTGYGIVIRNATTGIPFKIVNNSNVDKFVVDKDGNVNIPTGATYQVNGVPIGGGTTYTGTAPIIVSGSAISADTGYHKNALATFYLHQKDSILAASKLSPTGDGSGLTGITASQVGAATSSTIHDSISDLKPVTIAYTTAIPLTRVFTKITGKTLTTSDALTIASNPIEGGGATLLLIGDSSHNPDLTAFDYVSGSYDNTKANLLTFIHIDGYNIVSIINLESI